MKNLYTVTLPDGTKAARKSERNYSHAVAIFCPKWDVANQTYGEFVWKVVSFAANQALAEKATSRYRKWANVKDIVVLPIAA